MSKQPYIAFYVGDWLKETGLVMCSLSARGFWVDLICNLHVLDRGGQITGTLEQFSRLCRCTTVEAHAAINELQNQRVADVTERDKVFTVTCRRMKREHERKQKYRENASKGGSKTAQNRQAVPDNEGEGGGELKVIEFCRELGLPDSDGVAVFQKWQGNGFTNGGRPIRDWKATIRSWKASGYLPSQKAHGSNGSHPAKPESVMSIKDRIKAVDAELHRLRSGPCEVKWLGREGMRDQVKVYAPDVADKIDKLKARRKELEAQLR